MTPEGDALFDERCEHGCDIRNDHPQRTLVRRDRRALGSAHPRIRDGHIAAITAGDLDETGCPQVIDAAGKWVLPGMLDIHTHYDVEVLGGPSLSESLRHGVTTVLLGSCSLSTVYVDGQDAGDIFGRVEAIPREHVIDAVNQAKTWANGEQYIAALESRPPLGPNVAAFLGHSDMRAATMGLDRATRRDVRPTRSEQAQMERMLTEALRAGFVGMSSQQLLFFDKLDGGGMPLTHPSVDLRQAARAAPAEVAVAPLRAGPAVRARHPEPAQPRFPARSIARHRP